MAAVYQARSAATDTCEPGKAKSRRLRIALAVSLLAAGIFSAWLFRKTPSGPGASAALGAGLVLRSEDAPRAADQIAAGTPSATGNPQAQRDPSLDSGEPAVAPGVGTDSPRNASENADPAPSPASLTGAIGLPEEEGAGKDAQSTALLANSSPLPDWHEVQDGDTLPDLASRYLGGPDRYLEIYRLNRDVLDSPDILPIGVNLRLPARNDARAQSDPAGQTESGAAAGMPLAPLPRNRPRGASR